MKDQYTKASPSFQKAVSLQMKLIFESQEFNATPQQIALLKFIVNQTLAGKGRETNDYTVAAEIFGRGAAFDVSIDPIVSRHAEILRRALARYYQNTDKNDPIRIDIPNGTNVPVFKKRELNGP